MRRLRICTTLALCGLVVLAACFVTGCGGGGGSSASTGVEVVGQLIGGPALVGGPASGPLELNPYYANAYQIPSAYSIAISKLELLRDADDPDPYVVFDTGDVTNARVISFNGGTSSVNIGNNSQYPEPGTYQIVRITCAYQQFTILADVGDGNGHIPHSFRVYNSTVGDVQDGDVLIEIAGTYNWIKGGGYYPITGDRPDIFPGFLAQHTYLAGEDSNDPNTFTVTLPSPIVVPATPTGRYRLTAGFNLSASPEDGGSTGTFVWDDVTEDGLFKPGIDMAEGGDGNAAEYEINGPPLWTPLGPTITFTSD